jgi:AraC-like DNA-binding protein
MNLVFSTDDYEPSKRYAAWRDAICDVYVNVDVKARDPDRYRGFIREAKFGEVVLTDILLSEQRIRRNNRHNARLDKDCYYVQLLHKGRISVLQRGETHNSNAARAAIFSATEQYELYGHGEVRSFYLEIPRDEFARRFPRERIPVSAVLNTTQGLGRIATEFCATLATEGSRLDEGIRTGLGGQLMDVLAFALLTSAGDMPATESSVKKARLRSVQHWMEAHVADATLSLEKVAAANGMSLRYLHVLFEDCEMSASEWIWNRRLQLAYDCLARGEGGSITAVAFDHGFNSSAHFSTMFRRKYGVSPRDVGRPLP